MKNCVKCGTRKDGVGTTVDEGASHDIQSNNNNDPTGFSSEPPLISKHPKRKVEQRKIHNLSSLLCAGMPPPRVDNYKRLPKRSNVHPAVCTNSQSSCALSIVNHKEEIEEIEEGDVDIRRSVHLKGKVFDFAEPPSSVDSDLSFRVGNYVDEKKYESGSYESASSGDSPRLVVVKVPIQTNKRERVRGTEFEDTVIQPDNAIESPSVGHCVNVTDASPHNDADITDCNAPS